MPVGKAGERSGDEVNPIARSIKTKNAPLWSFFCFNVSGNGFEATREWSSRGGAGETEVSPHLRRRSGEVKQSPIPLLQIKNLANNYVSKVFYITIVSSK